MLSAYETSTNAVFKAMAGLIRSFQIQTSLITRDANLSGAPLIDDTAHYLLAGLSLSSLQHIIAFLN